MKHHCGTFFAPRDLRGHRRRCGLLRLPHAEKSRGLALRFESLALL